MDKGSIKIKNELTYARNWTRKACQAAKNTTRTAHMSKMYIKLFWWRNSLFNYLFLLRYTDNYFTCRKQTTQHWICFTLKQRKIYIHYVIYTSTISNMLSKIHLHLFSNLKHATFRLIINGCYYVTLLSGTIISHLFLYHPYFMIWLSVLPYIKTVGALGSYYLAF